MEPIAALLAFKLVDRLLPQRNTTTAASAPLAGVPGTRSATATEASFKLPFTKVLDSVTAVSLQQSPAEHFAAIALQSLQQLPEVQQTIRQYGFAGITWELSADGELQAFQQGLSMGPLVLSDASRSSVAALFHQAHTNFHPGTDSSSSVLQLSLLGEQGLPAMHWTHAGGKHPAALPVELRFLR